MSLDAAALASPVVVFGLASALAWGAADFGGGLTSRRAALFGVVVVSQLVGMVIALGLAAIRAEPLPGTADVAWSLVAGAVGSAGILGLYHGLAVGRMGVVAPITGVLAATIPAVTGYVLEGSPPPIVSAGIVLALAAVVLVTRVPDPAGRRSGAEFAVVGGLGLGLFGVAISQIGDGLVFGPLAIVRATEGLAVAALVLVGRQAWRLSREVLPAVALVGLLDMAGNSFFILAVQSGALAVAAVLSSLYPVTTILLATIVLRERLTRPHAFGVALALVAIVLIAGGSG